MLEPRHSRVSTGGVTLLRLVIGWHPLYEGIVKTLDSRGPLAPFFRVISPSDGPT